MYFDKLDPNEKMIVRDYLALERTKLANTRTLLAWIRTAIGFAATGFGLMELLDHALLFQIGFALVCAAPILAVAGFVQFLLVRRRWRWMK